MVGPVAAGGLGIRKFVPAISMSRLPPVGPEFGVMLLMLIDAMAILLHKRKNPGATREGDTGA